MIFGFGNDGICPNAVPTSCGSVRIAGGEELIIAAVNRQLTPFSLASMTTSMIARRLSTTLGYSMPATAIRQPVTPKITPKADVSGLNPAWENLREATKFMNPQQSPSTLLPQAKRQPLPRRSSFRN